MNNTLEDLRKQIDELDQGLLTFVSKRMDIVRRIGKLKKAQGKSFLDEKRWQEVLEERLAKAKVMNLSKDFVEKLYNLIHQYSLDLEKNS